MARSDSERLLQFESLEARRSLTANIAAPLAAEVASLSADAASLSAQAAEVRAFESVSNREILRHVQTLEAIDVEKVLPESSAGEASDRWLRENSPTSVLRSSNNAWK